MTLYRQLGALTGAAGFLVITLLFWPIAGALGLVGWLVADAVCAALGAIVGSMVFSAHRP